MKKLLVVVFLSVSLFGIDQLKCDKAIAEQSGSHKRLKLADKRNDFDEIRIAYKKIYAANYDIAEYCDPKIHKIFESFIESVDKYVELVEKISNDGS